MTVPTADYEVQDEDYEAWCKCGSKIMEWIMEKEEKKPAYYQKFAEMYGDMIYNLLVDEGGIPGEDFWFEAYV